MAELASRGESDHCGHGWACERLSGRLRRCRLPPACGASKGDRIFVKLRTDHRRRPRPKEEEMSIRIASIC